MSLHIKASRKVCGARIELAKWFQGVALLAAVLWTVTLVLAIAHFCEYLYRKQDEHEDQEDDDYHLEDGKSLPPVLWWVYTDLLRHCYLTDECTNFITIDLNCGAPISIMNKFCNSLYSSLPFIYLRVGGHVRQCELTFWKPFAYRFSVEHYLNSLLSTSVLVSVSVSFSMNKFYFQRCT